MRLFVRSGPLAARDPGQWVALIGTVEDLHRWPAQVTILHYNDAFRRGDKHSQTMPIFCFNGSNGHNQEAIEQNIGIGWVCTQSGKVSPNDTLRVANISHECLLWFVWLNHPVNGLVQDCSNSIANALELLQSCTKPSTWSLWHLKPQATSLLVQPFVLRNA